MNTIQPEVHPLETIYTTHSHRDFCPLCNHYETSSEQRTADPTMELQITLPLFSDGDKIVMLPPGKKTFKDRAMPNQPWYARFRKGGR